MQDSRERETMVCPLNGKLCVKGMREDFPKDTVGSSAQCRWWVHLYGKDPQTEKTIDQFDCSMAWLPVTTIEGSQMIRQLNASVDAHRNEMHENFGRLAQAVQVAGEAIAHRPMVLIPDGSNGGKAA